jgi:hypothetical protein
MIVGGSMGSLDCVCVRSSDDVIYIGS